MNTVGKIQQLQSDAIVADENLIKLKEALDEYHRLVQEGKLIPRKNNVQDIYTVYAFKSNAD
ncbi:MAG: hypothetical protein K2N94_16655 [Lachnospiraceae bacterium]|nr:hypothetical protein [Lachnospiraceae bacterium]